MPDLLSMTDVLVSNSILLWLGLRLVKRLDILDQRIDDHETRLAVTEQELSYGRQKKTSHHQNPQTGT